MPTLLVSNIKLFLLQPAQENIVGKEKKRKKLDEIVLGLSAAKGKNLTVTPSPEPARSRSCTILPDVTVTPAAPPTSSAMPSQKPFSVTVTNVPPPQASSKELSSFLQQSLEQKGQKASTMTPMKSYSHEAKVNKWLAEQAVVDTRRRGLTPRLSPDEHVPVVHRVTGKRLAGHKAPQLKHLAQWIAENPMYDIDPKWTEGIKEHVKLPQDVRSQRHSPMQPASSVGERKKGRPPTLDAASANVLSSSAHLNQSLSGLNPALLASLSSLSAFDPKTLAATLSNLTGFDPKLLNSFDPKLLSSLSFDPKNNPLLNSFNSMPNLLGNMAGGNIFANLAGLGLPGFSSLDMNSLGNPTMSGDKSKSRKTTETPSPSTSKSNQQFPFVFPNPNMMYPQLGLSGLNPFGMHSGVSSTYDALGLLGSNIAASSGATSMQGSSHSSGRASTKTTTPRSSTVVSSSSASRHQKVSDRQQTNPMSQMHMPPDPYLLESLSKQAMSYESFMRMDKRARESEAHDITATDLSKTDKKKLPYDALRSHVPPEFAAVQEKLLKGDKKDIDISKMLLEQMASGALSASLVSSNEIKKAKDIEKECYDKLSKNASDYMTRTLAADDGGSAISLAHKRSHDDMICEPENLAIQPTEMNPAKKIKDSNSDHVLNIANKQADNSGEMDLEDLIAPSTVIKTGMKASDFDTNIPKITPNELVPSVGEDKTQIGTMREDLTSDVHTNLSNDENSLTVDLTNKNDSESKDIDESSMSDVGNDAGRRGNKKKTRKSTEDLSASCPRRELRSSAGRQSTDTMN